MKKIEFEYLNDDKKHILEYTYNSENNNYYGERFDDSCIYFLCLEDSTELGLLDKILDKFFSTNRESIIYKIK